MIDEGESLRSSCYNLMEISIDYMSGIVFKSYGEIMEAVLQQIGILNFD